MASTMAHLAALHPAPAVAAYTVAADSRRSSVPSCPGPEPRLAERRRAVPGARRPLGALPGRAATPEAATSPPGAAQLAPARPATGQAAGEGAQGAGAGAGGRGRGGQSEGLQLLSSAALVLPALAAEAGSYSQASYYTSLGLFIMSVPGVWSLIKRSTKSKIVKKTFVVDGPGKPDAKPLSAIAGEITSLLTRRNYKLTDRGEVVRFEGVITPSRSQAAFLVFCSALSLGSVALVLTITSPEVGENWYWLMALSPLAGAYYWRNATRTEEVKVKMVIADDEKSADVIIQGGDDEVERLRKELALMEKGMVYVKGILE